MTRLPARFVSVAAVCSLLAASTARAQESDTGSAAEADSATASPTPADSSTGADSAAAAGVAPDPDARARELYDLAFQALAQGERDLAASLLRELAAMPHPLAARANALVTTLAAAPPAPGPAPAAVAEEAPPASLTSVEAAPHGEKRTGMARAEIAFFQTVHGIALGAELCMIAECDGAQPWALALMLGAGTGFGTSWHFTSDGVRPGLSRALTDGVLWGASNGLGLMLATGALDGANEEARVVGAHLALGQLAGLGLGGGLYHLLEPTAGQVSTTTSGGIWSVALVAQAIGMFEPDWNEKAWAAVLLVAGDLGTVGGAFFAAEEPMSTSRVLLIDAAGLLGGLTGLGISVLAQGDDLNAAPTLGSTFAGTFLGLGLGYYFSSGWDAEESAGAPTRLALVPARDGVLAAVHGVW